VNTDDLIRSLVRDTVVPRGTVASRAAIAGLIGISVSLVMLLVLLGVRPDASSAIVGWRLPLKAAFVGLLIMCSAMTYVRAARPEALRWGSARILLFPPLLILGGVVVELLQSPSSLWMMSLGGKNPTLCMIAIPSLSVLPLAGLILAMRHGAPASPAQAGLLAGLLAGSLGAAVYILRCTDDSPLFVAVWYVAAILAMAAAGRLMGAKALRW
jgi:hypothetical protein